ncbi:LamG-like jellyroll fold domain-containing protein [Phycisphaerales bacterium AB-hyl4]|uniref:LamG-like jellyroll fold domain-containing protein n=1 Tax=Natronomicrosphaera hydrolytica TaxID=3242702 RepID=A0ABV4UAP3_9BACT
MRYEIYLLVGIVSVMGALATTEAGAIDGPPGQVFAHWSFDEKDQDGDIIRDLGPHGFHGTIKSQNDTSLEPVEGVRGQALRFPDNHQSWIELTEGFQLEPPFTITAWVKIVSRRSTMEILGQKAHSWDEGMRFVFSLRRMFFEYSDGDEDIQVRNDVHQTSGDQWAFVAVVHDGQDVALYVDAEQIQKERAAPAVPTSRRALIGNYVVQKETYGFVGTMDELIIMDEALSSEQLVELGLWVLADGS